MKQYGAEFFGTFWLVLGGCGSAVLAAAFPDVGIGLLGAAPPAGRCTTEPTPCAPPASGGPVEPFKNVPLGWEVATGDGTDV